MGVKMAARLKPDLFLCHSSVDKKFVRRLARDLFELSVYAWFDEWELAPGNSLHESIGRAIEKSHYVGVVISPDSVDSKWCKKELHQALSQETDRGRALVIPLRYRAARMPPFLADKLYLDFTDRYMTALTRLAGHIHGVTQQDIIQALIEREPASVREAVETLKRAGISNQTLFDSRDWATLVKLFEKHRIELDGRDSLSFIHPKTGRKHQIT
jgi:hypothetical protein